VAPLTGVTGAFWVGVADGPLVAAADGEGDATIAAAAGALGC